jgi:hypothetical protein
MHARPNVANAISLTIRGFNRPLDKGNGFKSSRLCLSATRHRHRSCPNPLRPRASPPLPPPLCTSFTATYKPSVRKFTLVEYRLPQSSAIGLEAKHAQGLGARDKVSALGSSNLSSFFNDRSYPWGLARRPHKEWFQNLQRPDNEANPYRKLDHKSLFCCGAADVVKTRFRVEEGSGRHPEDV